MKKIFLFGILFLISIFSILAFSITFVSPPQNSYSYYNSNFTLNINTSSNYSNCSYKIDSDNFTLFSTNQTSHNATINISGLSDGIHYIYVNCTLFDNSSQYNESSISFYIDTKAPVYLNYNSTNLTPSSGANITIFAQWNDTTFQHYNLTSYLYKNGVLNSSGNSSLNWTNFTYSIASNEIGQINFTINATDILNYTNVTPTISVVASDRTPPSLSLVYPDNDTYTSNNNITFNYNVSDNVYTTFNCALLINGTTNQTNESVNSGSNYFLLYTISDGTYTWGIKCYDNNSNMNLSSNRTLTIDATAPTTIVSNLTVNDSDLDGNIEINWLTDDSNYNHSIYRSTAYITNINANASLTLDKTISNWEDNTTYNGTTYFYAVVSIDRAGNYNLSLFAQANAIARDNKTPKITSSITATNLSDGSIYISWTAVTQDINDNAEITGVTYRLYKRQIDNVSLINTSNDNDLFKTLSTNSYLDIDISASKAYTYVVTTVDDGGNRNDNVTGTNNITKTTASNCSGSYNYSSWGSCLDGIKTRTCSRTCYFTGGKDDCDPKSLQLDCIGGSSGGDTGGTSNESSKHSMTWAQIVAGIEKTMTIADENLDFTKIIFQVKTVVSNAKLEVSKLSAKPSSTSAIDSNNVYQYIKIDKTNLEDLNLAEASIEFKVKKSWLTTQNVNENNIVLFRYSDDEWNELTTELTSDDATNVHYSSTVPGFSYFAIGEKKIAATQNQNQTQNQIYNQTQNPIVNQTQPQVNQTLNQTQNQTGLGGEKSGKDHSLTIFLLVLAIVVAGLLTLYIIKTKRRRGLKEEKQQQEEGMQTPMPSKEVREKKGFFDSFKKKEKTEEPKEETKQTYKTDNWWESKQKPPQQPQQSNPDQQQKTTSTHRSTEEENKEG